MKKIYGEVCSLVLEGGYKRATKYVSEKLTIKATCRCKKGTMEAVLTVGKPNYAERQFIKLAKKAGGPFPIKKIQLKAWALKKK